MPRLTLRTWGGDRQHYEVWQREPYRKLSEGDLEVDASGIRYMSELLSEFPDIVLISDRTKSDDLLLIKKTAREYGIEYTNVAG